MTMNLISLGAFFVEWWVAYLFNNNLFGLKKSKMVSILGGVFLYIPPALAFIIADNFFINLILFLVVNFLYSYIFFKSSWIKCFISSAILTALLGGTEFLVMILLSVITNSDINKYLETTATYALAVSFSKTLFLLLSILISRMAFFIKTANAERSPAFLFIFPISTLFIDFSFWIITITTNPASFVKVLIGIGSIILLISILLTYAFYGKAMRRSQEFFQLQHEYEKVQVDKEYYSILDHQNELLRTFIHDEKSHLTALQTMSSPEEIHTYVNHILGELQYASPVGSTKNKMLDLILGKYTSLCKMNNICFSYTTITANLSFMEDTDLVSLMSNILDNAVEAAETAERGRIELTIKTKVVGLTILTCENTSGHAPIVQNGKLKTSKANKSRHGIGIKSIVRTAKKYDGTFEWTWDNYSNLFTVTIAFER